MVFPQLCFHLNRWDNIYLDLSSQEHLINSKTSRGSNLDLELLIFCQNTWILSCDPLPLRNLQTDNLWKKDFWPIIIDRNRIQILERFNLFRHRIRVLERSNLFRHRIRIGMRFWSKFDIMVWCWRMIYYNIKIKWFTRKPFWQHFFSMTTKMAR